ncbi:MAG: glycosyltransferase family 9 protein [Betaproteobacteria bacterium]
MFPPPAPGRGTLVFHHNGIGDYVMSLPALRLLAQAAPKPVCLVSGNGPASFLYDELDVDQRLHADVMPAHFAHGFDPVDVPMGQGFDVFISLATWIAPAICKLAQQSGARTRIGFFSQFSLRLDVGDIHDFERMFALALPFSPGARFEDFTAPCRVPEGTPGLRTSIAPGAKRLLVVHPDSRKEKMWPIDRYDTLLRAFLDDAPNWHVAVLNTPHERLRLALETGRASVVLDADLATSMRLVTEADLFLGIDSCMLHVADLARIPGIALFGPTRAHQFGYRLGPNRFARNLEVGNGLESLGMDRVLSTLHEGRKEVEWVT